MMKKTILIGGSVAYDRLMTYKGSFKDVILPENLEHLSISFFVGEEKNYFGGCACNVAYSLKLLGENPLIFGVAGDDFDSYEKWLKKNEISSECIEIDETNKTATAYILTDAGQRQIAMFAPGAMSNAEKAMHFSAVEKSQGGSGQIAFAILGAEAPFRMMKFAEECLRCGIKYFFDPGQAMSGLNKEQIEFLIKNSSGVFANEYEAGLMSEITGLSLMQIANDTGFFVRTLAEKGAEVYENDNMHHVKAIKADVDLDVTGCGDSFRAGFLHGLMAGKSLKRCCEIGATVASFVIAKQGTQRHSFSYEEFVLRLSEHYGE
ncbi:carbohydrate kinase family protein [Candidatus Peregrinibacteria bacterium]|nr:carbohydrate kinase family protein [Candidatus Peregrinibacteria bacterium]